MLRSPPRTPQPRPYGSAPVVADTTPAPSPTTNTNTTDNEDEDSDRTGLVVVQLLFWGLLGLTGLLGLCRAPSRFAAPFVFVTPR